MRYIPGIMAVMLCAAGCGRADSETAVQEGDPGFGMSDSGAAGQEEAAGPEGETPGAAQEDGGGAPEIKEDSQTLEKDTA